MNKKYDKEVILNAGIELIREQGYASTGVQHMLKACNIPKGSFYNFFESKQAFTVQAIKQYGEKHLSYIKEIDSQDLGPVEKLMTYFKINSELEHVKKCGDTCFLISLSNEVTEESDFFSEPITDQIDQFKSITKKWVIQGQDLGEIRTDFSPELLTQNLHDTFNGVLMRMKHEQSNQALIDFKRVSFNLILKN